MTILIDRLPASSRRKVRLVIDPYVRAMFSVLIPPGPALTVKWRLGEGVQVLD